MAIHITEATVEEMVLGRLHELGWQIVLGQDIAPDAPAAERVSYGDVVLAGRLQAALARINPGIPAAALEVAARKITRPESASLVENNRRFHRFLTDGVAVEFPDASGRLVSDIAWWVDAENPANNDWLAVAQLTVIEHRHNRRPDIVLFLNGLPLAVIELKDPTDENATIRKAFNQLQT